MQASLLNTQETALLCSGGQWASAGWARAYFETDLHITETYPVMMAKHLDIIASYR